MKPNMMVKGKKTRIGIKNRMPVMIPNTTKTTGIETAQSHSSLMLLQSKKPVAGKAGRMRRGVLLSVCVCVCVRACVCAYVRAWQANIPSQMYVELMLLGLPKSGRSRGTFLL